MQAYSLTTSALVRFHQHYLHASNSHRSSVLHLLSCTENDMISILLRNLSLPIVQPYERTLSQRCSHETESSRPQISEEVKFLKLMKNDWSPMTNLYVHGVAYQSANEITALRPSQAYI